MYFDPESFERIKESSTLNPCPYRPYSLAVVDSFAMYMLLQLHIKGNRFAEQRVTFDVLLPVIARSGDNRKSKNEDIKYLLEVLQGAGMIIFKLDGRNILYTISKCVPKKLSHTGEPRALVRIKRSNRYILENTNFKSNVPFAIFCLMSSLRRWEDGAKFKIIITFKQMKERLKISYATLSRYKEELEKEGYLYTYFGVFGKGEKGDKDEYNKYQLFDHGHNKIPSRYSEIKENRQRYKEELSKKRRIKKAGITVEPTQAIFDPDTEKKQSPESTKEAVDAHDFDF